MQWKRVLIPFVFECLGVAQGQACTIVLRGATQQILDEAERSIHDVLCVLSQTVKEPRICYGGGSSKTASLYSAIENFVF